MRNSMKLGTALAFYVLALALMAPAYSATSDDAAKVSKLALEVQRLENLRAVKQVQVSYAQYSQFGLWSQMASLFTDNGEAIFGNDDAKGRAAIGNYFLTKWGSGREGLAPGAVHTQLEDSPVVNLSEDGRTAKGRWFEISMIGQYGGLASWAIGVMENVYVKEGGAWRISTLHYYPYVAGSYEAGWKDVGPDLPIVAYHYTPANAAVPVPPYPADLAIPAIMGTPAQALAGVNRRIDMLNDEDRIRNLQNSYGYYIDRKMWDDAADLFSKDAVLEESDVGVYSGARSIRQSFERFGPQGLKQGQLNEHPLFDMTVTVNGNEARMRGIEWRELGDVGTGTASLGLATFVNRYVKGKDGIWRIREMRVYPLAMTDYYKGWGKSRLVTPKVTGSYAPDKPVPAADTMTDGAIPIFFQPNPATGQAVVLPPGTKITALRAILPASVASSPSINTPANMDAAIAGAERRLSRSLAYDTVDNITHAFGQYINDNDFDDEGALYADDGWRGKQAVGFCVGPDHIAKCEATWGGDREVHFALPSPRTELSLRLMFQPVIIVSDDGKTARERTRLHSFGMSRARAGVLSGAMYPSNQFKLVNGVWKADVISIEEPYWSSSSYEDGWARYKSPPRRPRPVRPDAPTPLPPDVPRTEQLKIRFWGIDSHPNPADVVLWPDIKPMWFDYVNPVSGRVPPNYCPNMKTCEKTLEAEGHKPVQ